MSKLEEMDPLHHPEVHGGNDVDEPPMEIMKTPESEMPPDSKVPEPVRPYDEGAPPVELPK
jgi:hypothetical protein